MEVSLAAISCELLKVFKKDKALPYSDLFNKIIQKKGIEAKTVFLPALSFLFLLGKVEYHEKTDIIEFKK
jgi:hypothetical protein